MDTINDPNEQLPPWLNLESVQKMPVVEKITSLSAETIRRVYPDYVVKLLDGRHGCEQHTDAKAPVSDPGGATEAA